MYHFPKDYPGFKQINGHLLPDFQLGPFSAKNLFGKENTLYDWLSSKFISPRPESWKQSIYDSYMSRQRTEEGTKMINNSLFNSLQNLMNKTGKWKEKIPGGLAEGKQPKDFNKTQIQMGQGVEKEHTPSKAVATEIAMDHLVENKKYYTYLKSMEKKMDKEKKGELNDSFVTEFIKQASNTHSEEEITTALNWYNSLLK